MDGCDTERMDFDFYACFLINSVFNLSRQDGEEIKIQGGLKCQFMF
jgi:hypothetical protein